MNEMKLNDGVKMTMNEKVIAKVKTKENAMENEISTSCAKDYK
jgi:hypothetical protein